MNKLDLTALLERVRNATGPSMVLEAEIYATIGGAPHTALAGQRTIPLVLKGDPTEWPHYTASIDAALALVERVLPGWSLSLYQHPSSVYVTLYELGDVQIANVPDRRVVRGPFEDERHNDACTPLAIIAAALLALTSNQEGNDEA